MNPEISESIHTRRARSIATTRSVLTISTVAASHSGALFMKKPWKKTAAQAIRHF
jgi:hypothetical protein